MRFRQHQALAQHETWRLMGWFAALVVVLVVAINLILALLFKLVMPLSQALPSLFFETNTGLVLLFIFGGCLVETQRLREGGGTRVAHWVGGREVTRPDDALERRLLNVVDEMAMASGQPVPRVFVMPREDAINAFVAGWGAPDLALCVTRGALDRLTRAELQGLIAHEFGHIKEDDLPLAMRMLALVWGLSLVHGYGQTLMAPDDNDRVGPVSWLIGLVFRGVGWLGWLAGRLLQAAVSRQRELLADASAIQFTRSADGLGNVLRKVWHDQQVLAGRMRHPQADMVASLLLHQPGGAQCLATHPRLPDRIRRICGTLLGPLPAPLLRIDAVEPRRPTATAMQMGGTTGRSPDQDRRVTQPAAPANPSPAEARRMRLAADKDALGRLQRLGGPTERRLAVLALMMNTGNPRETKLWHRMAEGLSQASRILDDVNALLPPRRVPEFERLCETIATEPLEQRRALVESARDLLRADGRVSPKDRLWWLALRHRMGVSPSRRAYMRPMTGQGRELDELTPDEREHVASLSSYLARFVPLMETPDGPAPESRAWLKNVMARCGACATSDIARPSPDADALMHALAGVQELSWMIRPMLLKAWVEEALNHSPNGLLSDDTADALRLTAGLIDSPMPPILEAHYPRS